MACTRCGKPVIPGSYAKWRHAALADAVTCTVPYGPVTAVFGQESLFDADLAVARG